jgi:hypothetical protein
MGVSIFPPASSGGGGGGGGDFTLSVGATGNTTYVLDRTYPSGSYELAFANGDTSFDIYVIAEDGTYAGYTNGVALNASADFTEVVVLGAASNESIIFNYKGAITIPSTAGDVATAGAFLSGVVTSSLPGIDDTTVVNGGNFAANVAVSFIDQSDAETSAKNVVRSSSTQLVVTRPDAFSPDDSPYTVKVVNPGIPVPSGTDAYLLVDSVTAGTNPAWQTTGDLLYNVGAASPDITLLATDSEGSDIDYSVVSGTLPAGITLDGETGVLSGTFSGSASEGDSNSVTFKAIDTGGNFLNKAFNFVANTAPVWNTAAGPISVSPVQNQAYSFQLEIVGDEAATYALQSGSFNTGLSLSTSGLISGTNTDAAGTEATFTVRVTDAGTLFTDRQFTMQVFGASGGSVSTSGGYKYHTFSSSGTFQVLGSSTMEYLVVGAGGRIRDPNGGGGGAGGFLAVDKTISAGSYSVTVGSTVTYGDRGENSSFDGSVAIGGGRGSNYNGTDAFTGGSGGGNGGNDNSYSAGAAGTSGQGFRGGGSYLRAVSGGGGGAGGVGEAAPGQDGANGGPGKVWLNGIRYAAGGGGGSGYGNSVNGSGGSGSENPGAGGTVESSYTEGRNGIVIIRYAA